MTRIVSAFAVGLLFGLGLTISQMVDPQKVLAFLDVTGKWDPSLALVMGGALTTAAIGYRLVFRMPHPLLAGGFQLPKSKDLDVRLLAGSALFGIGWGLAGLCPGPAIAALGVAEPQIWLFFAGMAGGVLLYRLVMVPADRQATA